MNTTPFYTYTGTYGIDSVIIRLHCDLGTFARNTGNLFNGNQTIIDFRHFHFEQTLQENGRSTRQNNLRIIVLVVYAGNYCTGRFTFAIEVARDLFRLRQQQLVSFIVQKQHFFLPDLIYLCVDDCTYFINIFIINTVLFKFQNL